MYNIIGFIFLSLIFMTFTYLIIVEDNKKRRNFDNKVHLEPSVDMLQLMKEIDYMIDFYINDYLFRCENLNGNIFINDDRLDRDSKELANTIINSFSESFRYKISLYLTDIAMMDYVVRRVMPVLLKYAEHIDLPH